MRLKYFLTVALMAVYLFVQSAHARGLAQVGPPDPERLAEVVDMLVPREEVVPPVDNREFWDAVARDKYLHEHIQRAEDALDIQAPSQTEWVEAYLEYSRSGNRTIWQKLISAQQFSFRLYCMAECFENNGRFIPMIEQRIREFCSRPSWVMPAHDGELLVFDGEIMRIDLRTASLGADLSVCLLALGAKLDPEVKGLLKKNLRERVLVPFRKELTGEQEPNFWLTTTNNWNAVCLCGVSVVALGASDSREECAWYLASTENLINNFLEGFSKHGYCSEGLGYWGYGFGNFIVLTEYLRRATGGGIDLFDDTRAQAAASFPFIIEIADGIYPSFADCSLDVTLTHTAPWYVARRLGYTVPDNVVVEHPSANGFSFYGRVPFLDYETIPKFTGDAPKADPLRTFFPEAGVLVSRTTGENPVGIAIKAGHNEEHHNHNDVGSFVMVSNGLPVFCDPGSEVYTRDTFSDKRYLSHVHNSFGHSVPVVAGQLQGTGKEYCGKVLSTRFTDMADSIVIDLSGAYDVPELVTLVRSLEFNRATGTVTVTDHVEFSEPSTYSTALITFGTLEFTEEGFTAVDGDAEVPVRISADDSTLHYRQEELPANWHTRLRGDDVPSRFGIHCSEPVTEATITVTVGL